MSSADDSAAEAELLGPFRRMPPERRSGFSGQSQYRYFQMIGDPEIFRFQFAQDWLDRGDQVLPFRLEHHSQQAGVPNSQILGEGLRAFRSSSTRVASAVSKYSAITLASPRSSTPRKVSGGSSGPTPP